MEERYKVWQQFEATGEISHKPTNLEYVVQAVICFCILFVLPYIALLMTE